MPAPIFAEAADAVEEQHDLGALAQHGDRHDHRHAEQRLVAGRDRLAHRPHRVRHLAAVLAHPDIVPGEHDHGDDQHGRVEHLLPVAGQRRRDLPGEGREQRGPAQAGGEPARDLAAPPGDALGGRQHDADDQPGLQHLAEDDQRTRKHRYSFAGPAVIVPFACCG